MELEPELDACVQTQAKRQYEQLMSEILEKGEKGEAVAKFELLRLFLESTDFTRLRGEYEKHLTAGNKVKFTICLVNGKPEYEMKII